MEEVKPVVLYLERARKKDGKTFSEEAVYMFLQHVFDYVNKVMASAMAQGFDKKEPVDTFEIELRFKANGKPFDAEEVLRIYPKMMGFSLEYLAKMILKKASDCDKK